MIDRTKTMYTPNYEHDACGMGFITRWTARPATNSLNAR